MSKKTKKNVKKNVNNIKAVKASKKTVVSHSGKQESTAKEKRSEALKKAKNEHKQTVIDKTKKKIVEMSAALKSMGGVSKDPNTPTGKSISAEERKKIREAREALHLARRLKTLKAHCKAKNMSEEETKKSLDTLKKELSEQKRYDISVLFLESNRDMISEILKNEKITVTYFGKDYLWIKNTDNHVLQKLRELLPEKSRIWPYKAATTAEKPKVDKKPTNNTNEAKKLAKEARKAVNQIRFKAQSLQKLRNDRKKKAVSTTVNQLKAA